jgi:hypothetical protein
MSYHLKGMTTLTRLNALFQALQTRPLSKLAPPIQSHHNVIQNPKATLSLFSSYGAWFLWLLKFYCAARSHWDVMVGVGKSHSNVNLGDSPDANPPRHGEVARSDGGVPRLHRLSLSRTRAPSVSALHCHLPASGRNSLSPNSCFFSRNSPEALAL